MAKVILISILILQVFLRIPFLQEPLDRDEGVFAYMGQRVLAGEVPYRDVFDHKTPVVYYFHAAVIKFFGNSILAIRLFSAAYSLLNNLALFAVGYLLLGTPGALIASFLYALHSGTALICGTSSNTETFMVLPMLLALYFFLRGNTRGFFLAGLFSGLAVMTKQAAVFNFLALAGALALTPFLPLSHGERGKPRRPDVPTSSEAGIPIRQSRHRESRGGGEGLMLILGFLVFPLLFTLYFWLKGALPDFIYCIIFANQEYFKASPAPFFFIDPRYGSDIIWRLMISENGILWLLSFIALISILIRDRRDKTLLLVAWGFFSFLGVASATLFFGHYFIQLIPALSLLSAYALVKIREEKRVLGKVLLGIALVPILLLNLRYQYPFYFKYNPYEISEHKYATGDFVLARRFSLHLSKKIREGDKIFVWSAEPEVYFYLNKKAPGRYIYYYDWMENFAPVDQIFMKVEKEEPRFILQAGYAPHFPKIEKWVNKNYNLRMGFYDWKLFERKV